MYLTNVSQPPFAGAYCSFHIYTESLRARLAPGNTGSDNEPYPGFGNLQPNIGTLCQKIISHNKNYTRPPFGQL